MSPGRPHRVAIFDSGFGGLSVLRGLRSAAPEISFVYCADTQGFPYGDLSDKQAAQRTLQVMIALSTCERFDAIVVGCNTASTVALGPLREHFSCPVVGVIPAIKPAAEITQSRIISVLATPGTITREYTRNLIARFAADCHVRLVGCANLAQYAETHLAGREEITLQRIAEEVSPAFIEIEGRRTDAVVLGCTHYPLLKEYIERVAPWPVHFIDPTPAIVRRLLDVLSKVQNGLGLPEENVRNSAYLTGDLSNVLTRQAVFLREGVEDLRILSI